MTNVVLNGKALGVRRRLPGNPLSAPVRPLFLELLAGRLVEERRDGEIEAVMCKRCCCCPRRPAGVAYCGWASRIRPTSYRMGSAIVRFDVPVRDEQLALLQVLAEAVHHQSRSRPEQDGQ